MQEIDRQKAYSERSYQWPIPLENYKPPCIGWKEIMERRFEQVSHMPGNNSNEITMKYNGWLSAITSAQVIQNFTEFGWGLTRAPDDLVEDLRWHLMQGVNNGAGVRLEHDVEIIMTPNENNADESEDNTMPAVFVELPSNLTKSAMEQLLPLHSEWSGVPINPNGKSYGLRLYRNNSRLLMHTDKLTTHIIASILHVGSSDDAEEWPIVLEDWTGNTYEIILEVGDLLLYEAAKLYHGRPRPFKGSWYTSLFSHYYPLHWDTENYHLEGHYAIPPIWFEDAEISDKHVNRLELVGTGLNEPDCVDGWSALDNSVKLKGPGIDGVILSPMNLMQHQEFRVVPNDLVSY